MIKPMTMFYIQLLLIAHYNIVWQWEYNICINKMCTYCVRGWVYRECGLRSSWRRSPAVAAVKSLGPKPLLLPCNVLNTCNFIETGFFFLNRPHDMMSWFTDFYEKKRNYVPIIYWHGMDGIRADIVALRPFA